MDDFGKIVAEMRAEMVRAKGETALRLDAIAREQRTLQVRFNTLGEEAQALQAEQIVREKALALLEARLIRELRDDHAADG